MENYAGGLKSYWKKSLAYSRVDGGGLPRRQRRRRPQVVQLAPGGGDRRRHARRFWRIRVRPRVLLRRVVSLPGRILARIRDGYVSLMLKLAQSPALVGYGPDPGAAFARPAREYDEKVLVEIYKSLLAQGQIFPAAGGSGKEGSLAPAQIVAMQR